MKNKQSIMASDSQKTPTTKRNKRKALTLEKFYMELISGNHALINLAQPLNFYPLQNLYTVGFQDKKHGLKKWGEFCIIFY